MVEVKIKILSVAPNCAHGYGVLLPNESILLSSTSVAAPISLVEPTCRMGKEATYAPCSREIPASLDRCRVNGGRQS